MDINEIVVWRYPDTCHLSRDEPDLFKVATKEFKDISFNNILSRNSEYTNIV